MSCHNKDAGNKQMNLQTYIPLALRTEAPTMNVVKAIVGSASTDLNHRLVRTLHAVMGLSTEIGELLEAYNDAKKAGRMDRVNVGEEIGDCFWYNAIFIDANGIDLDTIHEDPPRHKNGLRVGRLLRQMSVDASILMDECKRALFYNKDFNEARLLETFWNLYSRQMQICGYFRFNPDELRAINISKLQTRYPEKFSENEAVNRDLERERKVLSEAVA